MLVKLGVAEVKEELVEVVLSLSLWSDSRSPVGDDAADDGEAVAAAAVGPRGRDEEDLRRQSEELPPVAAVGSGY